MRKSTELQVTSPHFSMQPSPNTWLRDQDSKCKALAMRKEPAIFLLLQRAATATAGKGEQDKKGFVHKGSNNLTH
eukprot:5641537-Amphidinium_carterae.1